MITKSSDVASSTLATYESLLQRFVAITREEIVRYQRWTRRGSKYRLKICKRCSTLLADACLISLVLNDNGLTLLAPNEG